MTAGDLDSERIARLIEASGELVAAELEALGDDAGSHPAPGEWCAKECAGHIIEAERRGFAGRIRHFLDADGPDTAAWDQEAIQSGATASGGRRTSRASCSRCERRARRWSAR